MRDSYPRPPKEFRIDQEKDTIHIFVGEFKKPKDEQYERDFDEWSNYQGE